MGQPKYTIYKYVRLKDGSWRYCRAALYANHTIKADIVIVGHREEKHSEGNYYLASGGQWILHPKPSSHSGRMSANEK